MGNKQSGVSLAGSQNHVAEPASRSFSWQPDPLFAVEPVKRGESFAGSGVRPSSHIMSPHSGPATMHRTLPYAASEFSSPGVYRNRQASSPNLIENRNGSVVQGDAAFGGVRKELMKPALKGNAPKTGNLVNTADSGYMTEIAAHDSDNSARGRNRGSRLSLNDAMLGGTEFVQQPPPPMMHPPPGVPIGPHFLPLPPPPGMIPFGPLHGLGPPPEPFLFPPMLNTRGALMDEKKAKKLRKKQQKNQQQLSRHSSMLGDMPGPGEFIPPGPYSLVPAPVIAYGPRHPPPSHMSNFRSRSIDNFVAAGLIQPPPIMAPPPPRHLQPIPQNLPVRRYNSQVDLSGAGICYQSATLGPGMGLVPMGPADSNRTPPAKKERKYEKRKDQQPGSLRESLSSSRGRLADAPFAIAKGPASGNNRNETSTSIEARRVDDKAESNERTFGQTQSSSHFMQVSSENASTQPSRHKSEVIYETLKGTQKAILATSAEVNTISVIADQDAKEKKPAVERAADHAKESPPPPTPKPVVITPEAKAILERNARILVEAEQEQKQNPLAEAPSKTEAVFERRKTEFRQTQPDSKMADEHPKIPTPPPPPPMPPADAQKQPSKPAPAKKASQEDSLKEGPSQDKGPVRQLEEEASKKHLDHNDKTSQRGLDGVRLEKQSKPVGSSEKTTSSSNDSDDIESMIEAILNPILPRKKYKRPKEFEPLDAWRGINVQQELVKRQPQRNAVESGTLGRDQQVVEERIQVRLVPAPPSRREQSGTEPIYLEYDERLPEFKKRLIETGSFDIPEVDKLHHRSNSQLSIGSRGRQDTTKWDMDITNGIADSDQQQRQSQPQLWRDYVAMEEAATGAALGNGSVRSRKTVDSNKGSLRRLKESVASIFRTKSTDQLKPNGGQAINTTTDDFPPLFNTPGGGRYAPSLTPSISKIKAGDSSDIDFSWVHDLETRFRLEREQFERELQTLKQKSATLQRNDYMLSPKLNRQHSYQPRISSEIEIGRDENRYSPSLRGPPPLISSDQDHYDGRYREKTFASSTDLAATSGRGALTSPPQGRMSAYHSQQALNEHVPSSRLMLDQQSQSRYFGVYDTHPNNTAPNAQTDIVYRDPYERSFRNELQHMAPANVRQKAALFENESHRVQREMNERNQQLTRQKQQRSASAPQRFHQQQYRLDLQPQRSIEADEPIYIPRPDYDESVDRGRSNQSGIIQHQRQNSGGGRMTNGHQNFEANTIDYVGSRHKGVGAGADETLFAPPYTNDPLIVNTAATGPNPRSGYVASPRSPSERRLARYYNSHTNVSSPNRGNGTGGRYESQPAMSTTNAVGYSYGRYSPSSRSPRLSRAQQQQYLEPNRTNVHFGRNHTNGYESGAHQEMMKGNVMSQRPMGNGSRGVAFAHE